VLEEHGYLLPIENPIIDGKARKQAWKIMAYSSDGGLL
jgi:hypothetical protein